MKGSLFHWVGKILTFKVFHNLLLAIHPAGQKAIGLPVGISKNMRNPCTKESKYDSSV